MSLTRHSEVISAADPQASERMAQPASRLPRWGQMALMFLLLAVSGNPALIRQGLLEAVYVSTAVLLAAFLGSALLRPRHGAVGILIAFGLLSVWQLFSLDFSAVTVLGFFTRLFIGYAAVSLLTRFPRLYVDAMVALTLLSLIFYIPQQIGYAAGINFASWFAPVSVDWIDEGAAWRSSIWIHTFLLADHSSYRNAGWFWEAGAFAGYANLALVFLAIIAPTLSRKDYILRGALLSLAVVTTFSTVGYLAYACVLLLHLPHISQSLQRLGTRGLLIKFAGLLLLVCGGVFAVQQDFMATKMARSFEISQQKSKGWEADRIGTLIFDWTYISSRPLTGWGPDPQTRTANAYLTDSTLSGAGRGNGMSEFTAQMGLPALLLWMFCTTTILLQKLPLHWAPAGLVTLVLCLNGENFLDYPVFLSFFFVEPYARAFHTCATQTAQRGISPRADAPSSHKTQDSAVFRLT